MVVAAVETVAVVVGMAAVVVGMVALVEVHQRR